MIVIIKTNKVSGLLSYLNLNLNSTSIYTYLNTMILIIKVSGLLSYLNSRLGHLYSPLKIRFLKYNVFFKYSLLSNADCFPKIQCFFSSSTLQGVFLQYRMFF